MKDSGIPWIGMIPDDWEVIKLKQIVQCLDSRRVPIDAGDRIKGSYPYWGAGSIVDYVDNYIFDEELILLGEDGAPFFDKTRPVAFLVKERIWVNNHIHVLKTIRDCASYITYCLNTVDYTHYINGSILNKLTQSNMNKIAIILPPLPTQQRIADFLDRKCAEIDELVALQETMIAELKRYKQSVITEAVTKGLDPDVPMKDSASRAQNGACTNSAEAQPVLERKFKHSGVEWIGEIPEGWSVGRIKNVASLFGRIGFRGYTSDDLNKDGIGAITLSPSNMLPMSMDYTNVTYLSWKKYEESPEIKIQNGDLLMVKTGSSYGKVSFVDNLPREATINPQILRIVPNIHSKYLGYFLQTTYFSFQVEGGVVGGTIPTISQEKINNFRVILPPLSEQRAIADYLDRKCAEIDELIAIKQQKIEALKEYKKSVIFEYVTGKKEVEG